MQKYSKLLIGTLFFCIFASALSKKLTMHIISRVVTSVLLLLLPLCLLAQTTVWRDIYKVKKKDTIYGIATSYGLTVEQLMDANPEFKDPDFKLKKGATVFIPYAKESKPAKETAGKKAAQVKQKVNIGVMLPLHDADGDGKRMVEYYRGLLVGCDSLRSMGISTEVHAWNVSIDDDIRVKLLDENAKNMDIIFGPLYTKQVKYLADFCKSNNIKLVIPFSISATDVQTNANVFQVYQTEDQLNEKAMNAFLERFKDCNPIFIGCNDATSTKGKFTSALRQRLEAKGISSHITNLDTPDDSFYKVFVKGKRNVVILNTGRSQELNLVFRKLNRLTEIVPDCDIAMFGYTDWLMYESTYRELFHKYNTYIPSTFYYYKGLGRVSAFEKNYQKWFGLGLQEQYIPRFALTGFDHVLFFVRGMEEYGDSFTGVAGESHYNAMQTPLKFIRQSAAGGMQNNAFQLVHYRKDGVIETVAY